MELVAVGGEFYFYLFIFKLTLQELMRETDTMPVKNKDDDSSTSSIMVQTGLYHCFQKLIRSVD